MRPYEKILGKVSPVFYKFIQYYDYYYDNEILIKPYLEKFMNVPGIYNLHFSAKNIRYYFNVTEADIYVFWNKIATEKIISLITGDVNTEQKIFSPFVEFIINMVINKFGFKDVYIYNFAVAGSLDNIFIALVGRSTYDTIRRNIK